MSQLTLPSNSHYFYIKLVDTAKVHLTHVSCLEKTRGGEEGWGLCTLCVHLWLGELYGTYDVNIGLPYCVL